MPAATWGRHGDALLFALVLSFLMKQTPPTRIQTRDNMPAPSSASADGSALLASLQQSLLNLRQPWPQAWPGLTIVFDHCMDRLGWPVSGTDPRIRALVHSAHEIAGNIEDAARQLSEAEPAYHNRLHMADAMVCITHLLLAQREAMPAARTSAWQECVALVVMLGHDYLHNGRVNRFPAELETIAVEQLTPILQSHGVQPQDQDTISYCILKTDPSGVKQSHALVADRAFSLDDRDCLAVLVQEADILGSTLPVTATDLTDSLAREWSLFNPDLAKSLSQPKSRIFFLENAALFSSPAAQHLGIPTIKSAQLEHLREITAAPAPGQ